MPGRRRLLGGRSYEDVPAALALAVTVGLAMAWVACFLPPGAGAPAAKRLGVLVVRGEHGACRRQRPGCDLDDVAAVHALVSGGVGGSKRSSVDPAVGEGEGPEAGHAEESPVVVPAAVPEVGIAGTRPRPRALLGDAFGHVGHPDRGARGGHLRIDLDDVARGEARGGLLGL